MNKSIVILLIFLGSVSYASAAKVASKAGLGHALRGSEGVGGGDEVGLEFQKTLQDVVAEVQVHMPQLFKKLEQNGFLNLAAKVKVVIADEGLNVGYLAYIQDSVAANLPEVATILVNRQRWLAISDYKLKKAIALHELLSLAKLESTGSYPLSSKYLANQGLSEDYLDSVLMPRKKKGSGGLAPRGVPRYEKSDEQRMQEQLEEVDAKIGRICEVYSKKFKNIDLVRTIGDAIEAVDVYSSMLGLGQPDRVQADAARDELSYLQMQLIKGHFGTPNHQESSMKAFCRK